jgi:hypothetical protein
VSGAVASVRNWPVEASRSDWPIGQAVLDGFVVERRLGEGGMGMVYLLQSLSTAKAAPPPKSPHRRRLVSGPPWRPQPAVQGRNASDFKRNLHYCPVND